MSKWPSKAVLQAKLLHQDVAHFLVSALRAMQAEQACHAGYAVPSSCYTLSTCLDLRNCIWIISCSIMLLATFDANGLGIF